MKIFKEKTTWAGIAGIIAALSGFFTGELSAVQAIGIGVSALVGILSADRLPTPDAPGVDETLPKASKK